MTVPPKATQAQLRSYLSVITGAVSSISFDINTASVDVVGFEPEQPVFVPPASAAPPASAPAAQ